MKCPKFEQLVDYLDNRLTEAESARVRAHLATDCQTCTETRAWYEGVRAIAASDESIEPPTWVLKRAVRIFETQHNRPRLVERIGQAVASLVFDSFARPAVSGVRSTETTNRQLLYRAGDYSIDLQVAPSDQSRADLIGQVLREGETTFESVSGLRLEIARGGEKTYSTLTDAMGEFKISGMDCGTYDLRVELSEGSITVPQLPVIQA
jgi:putative zinc finger protein